ncbi:MAG TPA: helix-turn-helix domain-containing protein [Prolixibacteraceae bacterium]|nr:helix-turn-helix domain-containing protein [Prolixibacteraceae bacterium]
MNPSKNLETPIFQLTVGEFLAMIKQEQKLPAQEPNDPEIFGIEILQKLTGYSKASIYSKTSKNEIPHFKRDGRLFFRKDEIMQWLTANRVITKTEYCSNLDNNLINGRRRQQ